MSRSGVKYGPRQKRFDEHELTECREDLRRAIESGSKLRTARAWQDLKDLTGFSLERLVGQMPSVNQVTLAKYFRMMKLPSPIQQAWGNGIVSSTVADLFMEIPESARVPLFDWLTEQKHRFHRASTIEPFIRRVQRDGVKSVTGADELPASVLPEEPVTAINTTSQEQAQEMGRTLLKPTTPEYIELPCSLNTLAPQRPLPPVNETRLLPRESQIFQDGWRFGGAISAAVQNIGEALNMSSADIEKELTTDADIGRIHAAIKAMIEQCEISLSLLKHVREAKAIRASMKSYA